MTIPSAFKFNNTITNDNVSIEAAMVSALTAPINPALLAAFASSGVGGGGPFGGRLTFQTATPVMNNVSGAVSHFWTPYNGELLPIWTGAKFSITDMGGELSQLATDTTKSPSAVVANTIYDIFGWLDGSTPRATRGPLWANSGAGTSTRGTGAGTSQLNLIQGIYVNQFDILNGPKAGFGTYLGSILSDSLATYTYSLGGAASGGVAGILSVWNYFNRVSNAVNVSDTGSFYTYTTNTYRSSRASNNNRITYLTGVAEDGVFLSYTQRIDTVAVTGAFIATAIAINATNTPSSYTSFVQAATAVATSGIATVIFMPPPVQGLVFYQALEVGDGAHANNIDAANFGASINGIFRG